MQKGRYIYTDPCFCTCFALFSCIEGKACGAAGGNGKAVMETLPRGPAPFRCLSYALAAVNADTARLRRNPVGTGSGPAPKRFMQ